MKVRLNIGEDLEEEIVINSRLLTKDLKDLKKSIEELLDKKETIVFYRNNKDYYLDLGDILFFETEAKIIYGHTKDEAYEVRYRLYELEDLLPRYFVRVSKSTIVNVLKVISIDRSLASYSRLSFKDSYKTSYVSRRYYKDFKYILEEEKI